MKQVKTAKGKVLNMQAMYDANQTTQAVGNANMNARGDVLGPGGKVVIPKNKVTSAYYATNPNAVKEVSIKQDPEEAAREAMKEEAKEIEKKIFLQLIDLNWKNHIQYLEQLRQVIGLRSYGQRDPLVEYKKEAFHSFETLLNKIRQDIVMILLNLKIVEKRR